MMANMSATSENVTATQSTDAEDLSARETVTPEVVEDGKGGADPWK
jgi:hypothetical protein